MFISDLVASLTPDVRRLRAFTKIDLAPGESRTVEFKVSKSELAFVNEQLQWVLEPGEFKAAIGRETVKFTIE